jgi:rod shape-determining protein MreC
MAVYRRTSRRRYVLLLVVLTSITLITLDRRNHDAGVLGAIGRTAHTLVAPVQRGVTAIARPVGNWFGGMFDSGSLNAENKRLRNQIADLQGQVRANNAAALENEQLKQVLRLPILANVPRTYARVIGRSPGNFESTATLNVGSRQGIVNDMPVIAFGGVVGRVVNVWRDGCTVLLANDSNFSVAVRITRVSAPGVATGRTGASTMELDLDDNTHATQVKTGDNVETSGFNGSSFPPGLQVGQVVAVRQQPGGQLPVIRVKPFVDFDRLDYVAILRWAPGQGPVASTTTTAPPTTTSTTPTTTPGATTSSTPGSHG